MTQGRHFIRAVLAGAVSIIAASALGAAVDAASELDAANWRLVDTADGITVYTRVVAASEFAEVRASVTVCATLPELVAFVEDVERFRSWIPDTREARLLARPTPHSQIYYIRTAMPWPVQHRDMVYRITETPSTSPAEISVVMEGLRDYLPRHDDAVRMQSVAGRWDFRESAGRTLISLQMHIEPGGKIPGWLANRRMISTPANMLRNLDRQFAAACRPRLDAAVPVARPPE